MLLNTRHIAELIEKGEINEIKEAMEKSMSPGLADLRAGAVQAVQDGKITQEEAMANADSATNMLWLINQATAGEITGQSGQSGHTGHRASGTAAVPAGGEEKKEGLLSAAGTSASFGNFKIDMNA